MSENAVSVFDFPTKNAIINIHGRWELKCVLNLNYILIAKKIYIE